ncbi:MAG: hypothetical protein ACFFBP_06500 [Promethearchaeota archaeon]
MSESMITLLGIELSKLINIELIASKGIILLATKDEYGSIKDLTIDKLQLVLSNTLKNRLNKLGIPNIDQIIAHLDNTIIKNQSILTMASF